MAKLPEGTIIIPNGIQLFDEEILRLEIEMVEKGHIGIFDKLEYDIDRNLVVIYDKEQEQITIEDNLDNPGRLQLYDKQLHDAPTNLMESGTGSHTPHTTTSTPFTTQPTTSSSSTLLFATSVSTPSEQPSRIPYNIYDP